MQCQDFVVQKGHSLQAHLKGHYSDEHLLFSGIELVAAAAAADVVVVVVAAAAAAAAVVVVVVVVVAAAAAG